MTEQVLSSCYSPQFHGYSGWTEIGFAAFIVITRMDPAQRLGGRSTVSGSLYCGSAPAQKSVRPNSVFESSRWRE